MEMRKLELSPGEHAILEYIIEQVTQRLLDIVSLKVTNKALELAKDLEFEKLEEYEKEVQKHVDANFPVASKMQRYSPLFILFNDMNNWMYGRVTADPCSPHHIQDAEKTEQGWSQGISYAYFQEKLGISLDVTKNCLDRLIQRDLLEKSRGIGGLRFRIKNLSLIAEKLKKECDGESGLPLLWFAVDYDHQDDKIKESATYEEMLTHVKEKYDFQNFFKKEVNELIIKMELLHKTQLHLSKENSPSLK